MYIILYHIACLCFRYVIVFRLDELLSSLNLTLESFRCLHYYGIHSQGVYRKVMAKPNGLTWKVITDEEIRLSSDEHMTTEDTEDGLNIDMKFSLQPSTYATSMLREVLENI